MLKRFKNYARVVSELEHHLGMSPEIDRTLQLLVTPYTLWDIIYPTFNAPVTNFGKSCSRAVILQHTTSTLLRPHRREHFEAKLLEYIEWAEALACLSGVSLSRFSSVKTQNFYLEYLYSYRYAKVPPNATTPEILPSKLTGSCNCTNSKWF